MAPEAPFRSCLTLEKAEQPAWHLAVVATNHVCQGGNLGAVSFGRMVPQLVRTQATIGEIKGNKPFWVT